MMPDDRPEFSVYVKWPDANEPIIRFVRIEQAMRTVKRIIRTFEIAAALSAGMRQPLEVIITDGGDETVLEWQPGKGVVFPDDAPTRAYFE